MRNCIICNGNLHAADSLLKVPTTGTGGWQTGLEEAQPNCSGLGLLGSTDIEMSS